jgi:predicted P-loop ATPase
MTQAPSANQLNKLAESLEVYAKYGYKVTPLVGKIPIMTDWVHKGVPSSSTAIVQGNFGIVLEHRDLVIDVDPRNFKRGDNPLKRFFNDCEIVVPKTLKVHTGGGGEHIYFRKPNNVAIQRGLHDYPGVEFKSYGQQVVGASSKHPDTLKPYFFLAKQKPQIAPRELLAKLAVSESSKFDTHKGSAILETDGDKRRFLEYLKHVAPIAKEGEGGNATTFKVSCRGRDFGLTQESTYKLMLTVWNIRCSPPWSPPELKTLVLNAYRFAKANAGNAKADADFSAPPVVTSEEVIWNRSKTGGLKITLGNTVNFLTSEVAMMNDLLRYNLFSHNIEFSRHAPWHDPLKDHPPIWDDKEAVQCRFLLSESELFEVKSNIIQDAAVVAAMRNAYHPVVQYLDKLHWDGVSRLDTWLIDYGGAEDTILTRLIAAKVLVAAVARVQSPGCKFDYVLILEGPQGLGKSMLINALAGDDWFADMPIDPHSKDTISAIQGKWLVELAEMEVTRRSETQALKAFITRRSDRCRPSYGRNTIDFPRQGVFIGTINPEIGTGYLKDTTGNRRFWPVALTRVSSGPLMKVRDQIWAEAVHRYKNGETLYIDDKVNAQAIADEQSKRAVLDPWRDPIMAYVHGLTEFGDADVILNKVSVSDIWELALRGEPKNLRTLDVQRIKNVMVQLLGWVLTSVPTHHGNYVEGFIQEKEPVDLQSINQSINNLS